MILYAVLAMLVSLAAWPYLWEAPLARFVENFRHMASNPQILPVLYNGEVLPSNNLPAGYFPTMLAITLTEPVWPLFLLGLGVIGLRWRRRSLERRTLLLVLAWFAIPLGYVLWFRPPMYDGIRHFLFVLPPVFIVVGFAFQELIQLLHRAWLAVLMAILVLLPGIVGIWQTHPYEYAYFNQFIGGMSGAYRRFETDFWITCYKDLLPQVDVHTSSGTLYALRQPANARLYAPPGLEVKRYEPDADETLSGDLLLLPTRSNVDLAHHPEAPVIYQVEKNGAVLCVIKQIP